ncbi:Coenzyme F420 hydrogenase/dehydrogenase, beta subunit C-terminal domain [Mycobacterium deserti]|uniref:Coenzyme F420 hydrogenase/dehydrogenase, beta subunit C-terminal domain n=1 Tax=Mycobacterium deserti TaxID=2978347 RepID=A0ABT2M521_9MYCO|nr:Coenzyme F420 hydrogenase/dehydrogenase, beta subunit C-terminal domain [Mycobacterium deserti]MCT7657363.1 Coenzyme F420 hydrogenase/dehydrogenase, beta subunit C-terminal domain [Mycobacterium deserti]
MTVDFNDEGQLMASYRLPTAGGEENKVCPFSDDAPNEDHIADRLYGELARAEFVGPYRQCYVGHAVSDDYRKHGSSGGLGRWLNAQLLAQREVDYVIHVESATEGDRYFDYTISTEPEELLTTARSAYYPVSMDRALAFILENPGRYAITAVPCFATALRNLAEQNPVIAERVKFVIGIICGHLKTVNFAKALALQVGVQPDDLATVEFRHKISGLRANEKGFVAFTKNGERTEPVNTRSLLGGDWGHGFFKYKACDYCDDVIAETADIAIGDAWLPKYMKDSRGYSVVVARHPILEKMIQAGMADGSLALEEVDPEVVVRSQLGGIRHRNEGLAQRLIDDHSAGKFTPKKRVEPASASSDRRYIYRFRVQSRERTRFALQNSRDRDGNYQKQLFVDQVEDILRLANPPLMSRLVIGPLRHMADEARRLASIGRRRVKGRINRQPPRGVGSDPLVRHRAE